MCYSECINLVNNESIDIKIEQINRFVMKLKKILIGRNIMFCLVSALLRTKHERDLVQKS